MKSQPSILFISEDYFYLFQHNEPNETPKTGNISALENIESDNNIAYIDAQHYNIIPDSLFIESKIDSYLQLTTSQSIGITPISNKLPQLNSILLWALDEKIKKKGSPGGGYRFFALFLSPFPLLPVNRKIITPALPWT